MLCIHIFSQLKSTSEFYDMLAKMSNICMELMDWIEHTFAEGSVLSCLLSISDSGLVRGLIDFDSCRLAFLFTFRVHFLIWAC